MDFDYSQLHSQFDNNLAQHNDASKLTTFRQSAFDQLSTLPMPKMTKFNFRDWPFITNSGSPVINYQLVEQTSEDEQIKATVDAQSITVSVPAALKEKGIIISDLFTVIQQYPQLISKYLMKVIKQDEDLLAAYHTAFLTQGLLIYVPEDVTIDTPIYLTIKHNSQQKGTVNFHLLIVAGANSRLQIIDHLSSPKDQTNPLTNFAEIIAGDNSEVHFSSLDHLSQTAPAYYQYRAAIHNHAKVEWAIGLMNECNTVGEVDSELIGEGASANSQLIALTANNQQLGINNRVTNRSLHSQGLINQRGVALGNSRLIFNGIGQIIHGAHGSKAEQQNRLLMMSPHATGDANPILLIDENDVEAGHAASVGKINQDQLYYLLSRGIPKHQAQRMVIRGFLSAVITAIPDKNVRQEMVDILERKLRENA